MEFPTKQKILFSFSGICVTLNAEQTSASKSLMEYISLNFNGMSRTVAELMGGIAVPVDTNGFANDLVTFRDRDDVLTLLIHLGYLTWNEEEETARIPNEEVRTEFRKILNGRNVNRK